MKSGDMRRYPSGYPYKRFLLILTREVRCHVEIPKQLSVQTISINPDPGSQVAGEGTIWFSTPFVNQRQTSPLTRRD